MKTVACVADVRCELGESPVWNAAQGVLNWLAIGVPSRLYELNLQTRSIRHWTLPELTSALTLAQDGRLILLSKSGLHSFAGESGSVHPIAEPPFPMRALRFNDCGCDPAGRLWTGTMLDNYADAAITAGIDWRDAGELLRFDPDLSIHRHGGGIGCPNTFAWSPDGGTFYTADSGTGCMHGFDFDAGAGTLANARIFCNPANLGIPDGSAVDVNGHLWNARWGAGCVARFAPDGTLQERVAIPAEQVTSCAFGGDGLGTLFITTARFQRTEAQLAAEPLAGGVFAFEPSVAGLDLPRYRLP